MLKDYKRQPDELTCKERKCALKGMRSELAALQQKLKDSTIPLIVVIDGWAAAGKGTLLNELTCELDPRFATTFCDNNMPVDYQEYPFLYPYFNAIPENGKMLFVDSGWADDSVRDHVLYGLEGQAYEDRILSVNNFEKTLKDNGYLLIKLFLNISKGTQKDRLHLLLGKKDAAWRVRDFDIIQHRKYDKFQSAYENFLEETSVTAPWQILDGEDPKAAAYDAFKIIIAEVKQAIEKGRFCGEASENVYPLSEEPRMDQADLSATISDEDYKTELKKEQRRLRHLSNAAFRKNIPLIICYEGWDAAGKGGNIRRVAYPIDPRSLTVHPIASPDPGEKNRHFLWRFVKRLPKAGFTAIFDRTWYGRVMVERLEGFCSENDWKRAYNEMNWFEKELSDWGAVIVKFWIHIDNQTQLERFTMRQNTPEKQWKITEEDWRNREKWDVYETAIQEMLTKTSTTYAPWHIIESNDKKYARVKALRVLNEALEKALKNN